jgi:cytidylate kinase
LGKLLAKELKYRYLDTGIMYRAVTWLALERGISVEDAEALGRLARDAAIQVIGEGESAVIIDGNEVGEQLRQPRIDRAVSLVSKIDDVRTAMVKQQQDIAREGRMVMVGRDIGTVVLPSADIKLFLVASVAERANRRYLEMARQGSLVDYQQVLKDLEARDELDTGRSNSPLRPAADAIVLDTDSISIGEVLEKAMALIIEGRGED